MRGGAGGAVRPGGEAPGAARRRAAEAWRRASTGWTRFWFAEIDGTTHALVRIAFAAVGLALCALTLPLLEGYYTNAGAFTTADARAWSPGEAVALLQLDVLGSYPAALALLLLLAAALACLLVGYRTRLAAAVSFVLLAWLQARNPTFLNGGDEILRLTGFYLAAGYLALAPEDRALTLDRRRTGADGRARMPAWPLRLLQVQVGLLYAVTGFLKLFGAGWWDGTAVYASVANANLTRFGLPEWAGLEPLFVAAGIAVVWWEFLFPALVAWERSRRAALGFGIAFHLGIFATMNIGLFAFAMLATYPAFFHRERTARRLEETVRRLEAALRRP